MCSADEDPELDRAGGFADVGGAVGAVDLAHKGVVMRCLEAQCESGQLLVDLFVNYDCDLEGANLFERMVLALVRIAQGTQDKDASAPQAHDEESLRMGVSLVLPLPCCTLCLACWELLRNKPELPGSAQRTLSWLLQASSSGSDEPSEY